jgi:hypothetical protein
MKRIEVTETPYFMEGAIKRYEGDIFTSELGQYYIDLGWAKDAETGETGERVIGVSKITAQTAKTIIGE